MRTYLEVIKPTLWGLEKPDEFENMCLNIMLYHDATGLGFSVIERQLKRGGTKYYGHHSMLHNSQVLRKALDGWANQQFLVGDRNSWDEAARNGRFPASIGDANLWIDSVDYRIKGKQSASRKGPQWSYKLNAPGRRYVTIHNARRKVVKVYGGHSPKLFDGTFLETHKVDIQELFKGARFVGDNHFSKGKQYFSSHANEDDIKFYTNYAKKSKKKLVDVEGPVNDADVVDELTNAHQSFNRDHQGVRSRVETPYAWISNTFKALSLWRETEEQLDYLVHIALAVHNMKQLN